MGRKGLVQVTQASQATPRDVVEVGQGRSGEAAAHPQLCVMVMTHTERGGRDIQHPGGRVVQSGGAPGLTTAAAPGHRAQDPARVTVVWASPPSGPDAMWSAGQQDRPPAEQGPSPEHPLHTVHPGTSLLALCERGWAHTDSAPDDTPHPGPLHCTPAHLCVPHCLLYPSTLTVHHSPEYSS